MQKTIHDVEDFVAQGDLIIFRVDALPEGVKSQPPVNGEHVVAHSESGHNHAIEAQGCDWLVAANDPMSEGLALSLHERRQREHTPEGWRPVED